jgi:hypothetical protein
VKKNAIDKAIEKLEAERQVIDLAILKLRAAQEKKTAAPPRVRRIAAQGITGQSTILDVAK